MVSLLQLILLVSVWGQMGDASSDCRRLLRYVTNGDKVEFKPDESACKYLKDGDKKPVQLGGLECYADNWRQMQLCNFDTEPSDATLQTLKTTQSWCCMMGRQPWVYTALKCQHKVMCKRPTDQCLYHPLPLTEHNVWELRSEWDDAEDKFAVGIDFDGCVEEGEASGCKVSSKGDEYNCLCKGDADCAPLQLIKKILTVWSHCPYKLLVSPGVTEENRLAYKVRSCPETERKCHFKRAADGVWTLTENYCKSGSGDAEKDSAGNCVCSMNKKCSAEDCDQLGIPKQEPKTEQTPKPITPDEIEPTIKETDETSDPQEAITPPGPAESPDRPAPPTPEQSTDAKPTTTGLVVTVGSGSPAPVTRNSMFDHDVEYIGVPFDFSKAAEESPNLLISLVFLNILYIVQ